jgi:hypothetical protein
VCERERETVTAGNTAEKKNKKEVESIYKYRGNGKCK